MVQGAGYSAHGSGCERRRRDRLIAWGASSRYQVSRHQKAPEGGRQIGAAALAAATSGRLSPLRGLRISFRSVFLGLTPQAMSMPPLRGWFEPSRRSVDVTPAPCTLNPVSEFSGRGLRLGDSFLQQLRELVGISCRELTAEVLADVGGGLALDRRVRLGEGRQLADGGAGLPRRYE